MASSPTVIFPVFMFIVFFLSIASAKRHLPQKYFNVLDYGAIADGKSENSPAFLKAWEDACRYPGKSRVLIPKGTFKIWSTTFLGPCRGPIAFVIKGVVKAPTNPGEFMNMNTWLGFRYVDRLSVNGGGYLDGQGLAAWPYNDCSTNPNCSPLPVTLRFDFVTMAKINHLRSINSKNTHINLFACHNVNISRIRLTSPGDSPNTDGIRIGASTHIKISTSVIQTGDDCVAMVTGSKNILVRKVTCGPGHGISIGSLGRSRGDFVSDVKVINCTFIGTQNGVRIKTWAAGSVPGTVSNVFFGYISMQNVNNPILIDQTYCPGLSHCSDFGEQSSLVKIKGVTFYNIWGTSSSKVAVALECSAREPCQNIILNKINLRYHGRGGPAISECSNVIGRSYGRQYPPSCV
ncbi:PREDICTED: exopolygalacturonase-like [Ipomoea nil]|uniref:exopolygalacturonase-like n=1 Tax=Ipomoea nil TaxID=35883 RepID=UPI000901D82B|nr:PREDICTED: exopolygalacturonase-like [Ipomoea nil]